VPCFWFLTSRPGSVSCGFSRRCYARRHRSDQKRPRPFCSAGSRAASGGHISFFTLLVGGVHVSMGACDFHQSTQLKQAAQGCTLCCPSPEAEGLQSPQPKPVSHANFFLAASLHTHPRPRRHNPGQRVDVVDAQGARGASAAG